MPDRKSYAEDEALKWGKNGLNQAITKDSFGHSSEWSLIISNFPLFTVTKASFLEQR